LAHAIGVPFTEAHARAQGGHPVSGKFLFSTHLHPEAARFSIIYVDGFDQRVVQEALLRPADWMQNVSPPGTSQFDFSHVMFIGGGECPGLDEVVAGMGRHPEQPVTGEALLALGVLPELVGRLSAIVRVPSLDEQTLSRIVSLVDFSRIARPRI
jgi:hypothetical protein